MRISINSTSTNLASTDVVAAEIRQVLDAGLSGYWAPMLNGQDTLTTLAWAGADVAPVELCTAIAPIPLRSPFAMAQQVLTVQEILRGRLVLGLGTSHEALVTSLFGAAWTPPIAAMRTFLTEFLDLVEGRAPERITPRVARPEVILGAVNPQMARLAAELADGVVTWAAGLRTFEDVIGPAAAGRERPFRVVCGLPLWVTDDVAAARDGLTRRFGRYDSLPSYQKVFQREGVASTAEISLVGDEAAVAEQLDRLAEAGVTEFAAFIAPPPAEAARTWAFLSQQAAARAAT
jgi:F420-dependent oxidoreductase-like protein